MSDEIIINEDRPEYFDWPAIETPEDEIIVDVDGPEHYDWPAIEETPIIETIQATANSGGKKTIFNNTSPVGWPAVNPTDVSSINIETYTYYRTLRELMPISKADVNDFWYQLKYEFDFAEGVDATTLEEETLLNTRKDIDSAWETLTLTVNEFVESYGSLEAGTMDFETTGEYESALSKISSMRYLIDTITEMLEKLNSDVNKEAANYLTGKTRMNQIFSGVDYAYDSYNAMNYSWSLVDDSSGDFEYYIDRSNSENVEGWVFANTGGYRVLDKTGENMGYSDYMYFNRGEETDFTFSAGSIIRRIKNIWNTLDLTSDFVLKYKTNSTSIGTLLEFIGKYDTWLKDVTSLVTSKKQQFSDYLASYPVSHPQENEEQRVKRFQLDAYLLDALLNDTNTRSVWAFLQVGNIKFSTWDDSNYITDFNYKKNGAGSANSFTFNLVYSPPPGDTNINILEKVIQKRKVFFLYGYNETDISSPLYSGYILSYTIKVEGNVIKYSVVGYSELAQFRDIIVNLNSVGKYKEGTEEGTKEVSTGIKAITYAKNILTQYLLPYNYKVELSKEVLEFNENQETMTVFDAIQNCSLFEAVQDRILSLVSCNATSVTETDADGNSSSSYIETTPFFSFTVDDSLDKNNMKTVTIIRVSSLSELQQNGDITPTLAFSWGGDFNGAKSVLTDIGTTLYDQDEWNETMYMSEYAKYNTAQYTKGEYLMISNLITSFDTQYKGEVTLARSYQDAQETLRYNKDGDLVPSYVLNNEYTTGDTAISDEKYSYYLWEKNTMFTYDASLTMIGLPTDIPIGTYIYIKPMVNGVEHHTSGYYMISGSDDTVSSSGFTTTLKLTKIIDKDADHAIQKIINNKKKRSAYELYRDLPASERTKYAFKDAQVADRI